MAKNHEISVYFWTNAILASCHAAEKFSFLPSLGFIWYPGMENSVALSEQPMSALRKIASFACKTSDCLDRSVVNLCKPL